MAIRRHASGRKVQRRGKLTAYNEIYKIQASKLQIVTSILETCPILQVQIALPRKGPGADVSKVAAPTDKQLTYTVVVLVRTARSQDLSSKQGTRSKFIALRCLRNPGRSNWLMYRTKTRRAGGWTAPVEKYGLRWMNGNYGNLATVASCLHLDDKTSS